MRTVSAPDRTARRARRRARGVTLTELLVVIIIMAILTSMAMVGYQAVFEGGDRAEAHSMIQRLYVALEVYRNEYGVYPEDEQGEAGEYFITARAPTASNPLGGVLWRLNHKRVYETFTPAGSTLPETGWHMVPADRFAFDEQWLDPVTNRLLDPWGQPYEYELGDSRDDSAGDYITNPDGPPNWDGMEVAGGVPTDAVSGHEPTLTHAVKIFSWGPHNQDLDYDEKVFDRKHLIYMAPQKE
jgi:prepilin-type N-terminal cleavage/methylation domain-containing protein